MQKLILAFVLFLSACSTTKYSAGIFHITNGNGQEGHNPVAIFEIMEPIADNVDCGITHMSHVTEGKPFNDRPEGWYDAVGCYWRIK